MNEIQLGLMLKRSFEKVRWVPHESEYRWKNGDHHFALTFNGKVDPHTFDIRVNELHLSLRDVDKAEADGRLIGNRQVRTRPLSSTQVGDMTTKEVLMWIVKETLSQQYS